MDNKILQGSTCGTLNIHLDYACDKCFPSIEKQLVTGKINKQKITSCERMWDDKWTKSRFKSMRIKHFEVNDYLNKKYANG